MNERPRGAKEFQRLLQRHAVDTGQLPQRIMHLVRVGVVCAMLDDVRHHDGGHLFIIKGGTAMQLRLGIRARATADLDIVFRGHAEEWLSRFDAAIADRTWNGFTVVRKTEPVPIDVPGLGYQPWRVPLQIRYEGRDFGSTALEVAIDETAVHNHELIEHEGIALTHFAIDPPRLIPCLDVPHQIAQKLHAVTEPLPEGNDRVRDIIDIWLLEALLEPDDLAAVRKATIRTFGHRRQHGWPPPVIASGSWKRDYPTLIANYPNAPQTLQEAVDYLSDLITRIDNVKVFGASRPIES